MSTENIYIEMLFKCYYRPLCLYAIHYIGNIDDAEDVVQESFLKFWNDCQNQSNIKNTKSYLYRIVRNKSIDKLREYKANIKETDINVLTNIPDDKLIDNSEHEARLWTAIDSLPKRQREILLMSKRDGLKYRDIAEELGISIKTVEALITKAFKNIRNKSEYIYRLLIA